MSAEIENGYTRVANEILDVLAKTKLNGTQFRIVMAVWRYTYGFRRKSYSMSMNFLSEATGVNKRQIRRELNALIEANIIVSVEEANITVSFTLGFNKHFEEWGLIRPQGTKKTGDLLDPQKGLISPPKGSDKTPERDLLVLPPVPGALEPPEIETPKNCPKENFKENFKENIKETIMSPDENEFMTELKQIDNYPFDRSKDLKTYRMLEKRYPNVDLVSAVKDWHINKISNPLSSNSNARSQFNTWCKNAQSWGKNPRGQPGEQIDEAERQRELRRSIFGDKEVT